MSIPPLPEDVPDSETMRAANALHSLSIHVLRRARAADRETGLTPERLSLLSVLVYLGPRTVGALAAAEGVSAPAISRIVSALETEGLARRLQGAKSDRREVRVAATAKGRRLMEAGRARRLQRIAIDIVHLKRSDLRRIRALADLLERPKAEDSGSA
jgi:DNA-binding MarR family transcriptional regulator